MYGYTRYDVGYCDWRGLVGSTGTSTTVLGSLDVTLAAGADTTHTKVTNVTGNSSGTLKYKVGASVNKPSYGDSASDYTALLLNTDIACASGNKIVVVEVDALNRVVKSSNVENVVVGA